jgi:hypothetical protein
MPPSFADACVSTATQKRVAAAFEITSRPE